MAIWLALALALVGFWVWSEPDRLKPAPYRPSNPISGGGVVAAPA